MSDSEFPPNGTPSPNKPFAVCQFDRVHTAVWRNVFDNGDVSYSASFSRLIPDKVKNFRTVTSFSARDMPHLKLAIDWAILQFQVNEATGQSKEDNT